MKVEMTVRFQVDEEWLKRRNGPLPIELQLPEDYSKWDGVVLDVAVAEEIVDLTESQIIRVGS